ncbi:hypothetical protein P3S68_030405 [Capsicum galapagoense]
MLSTPTPPQPPSREPPSPSPESEPSLKKQKVNEEESDSDSDSDDGGSSKFGELEPLWDAVLKLPSEGITTYDHNNVYDGVKEMYTPIFPGEHVSDEDIWHNFL